MLDGMRMIPHEAVPKCGSYEVRFPDSRPSRYFYWDDIPGRRLRPDLTDKLDCQAGGQGVRERRAARVRWVARLEAVGTR